MVFPYQIATLLYCFSDQDEVLLLKRNKEPNKDLWSPCGGKLQTDIGESPYTCACREAGEEIEMTIGSSDLHLTGLVSECGNKGAYHWLMFLFEVKPRLTELPKPHREGTFQFFRSELLSGLPIPTTDREQLWPLFWSHRGGFFAANCRFGPDGQSYWKVEESLPSPSLRC